jgi:hypothetical protein
MWKYWTLYLCLTPYLKSQNSLNCLSTVCFVCMKHLFGVCSMLPSLPGLPCKIVFNLKQTFTWLNKGKKRKKKILPKWWCTHQHSFFNLMYSMLLLNIAYRLNWGWTDCFGRFISYYNQNHNNNHNALDLYQTCLSIHRPLITSDKRFKRQKR